jgi:hypothetical protein
MSEGQECQGVLLLMQYAPDFHSSGLICRKGILFYTIPDGFQVRPLAIQKIGFYIGCLNTSWAILFQGRGNYGQKTISTGFSQNGWPHFGGIGAVSLRGEGNGIATTQR